MRSDVERRYIKPIFLSLTMCLYVYLSVYSDQVGGLSVRPSVCLSVCQSICVSVCLSLSPFAFIVRVTQDSNSLVLRCDYDRLLTPPAITLIIIINIIYNPY